MIEQERYGDEVIKPVVEVFVVNTDEISNLTSSEALEENVRCRSISMTRDEFFHCFKRISVVLNLKGLNLDDYTIDGGLKDG